MHLDAVAQHIISNTPGNVPATQSGNADPFTSGGAYRPGDQCAGDHLARGGVGSYHACAPDATRKRGDSGMSGSVSRISTGGSAPSASISRHAGPSPRPSTVPTT